MVTLLCMNRGASHRVPHSCWQQACNGAYMNAIYKHDPKLVPPLARDYRMTENTGVMEVGEGMLWRRTMQPTSFNLYIADSTNGQVALQARVMMQGQNTLIAVRLKVDRGKIQEIEHLWAGNINDAALELLKTPRPTLTAIFLLPRELRARSCTGQPIPISMRLKETTARSPHSRRIARGTRTDIRP